MSKKRKKAYKSIKTTIILLLLAIFLTSCSMVCLGLSSAGSKNESKDDETKGLVYFLDVSSTLNNHPTHTFSWNDYVIDTDTKLKIVNTPSSYSLLRSEVSPWEGFSSVATVTNLTTKSSSERITVAVDESSDRKPVFFRVSCKFSKWDESSKKTELYMVLSEVVVLP